jgi:hypothetical protein
MLGGEAMMRRAWLLVVPLLLGTWFVASLVARPAPTTNTPSSADRTEEAPASGEGPAMADSERPAAVERAAGVAFGREAEGRLAESAHAAERGAAAIDALIGVEHISEARTAAEQFLRRFPDGPSADHVRAMTGVHLRPSGPTAQAAP